MRRSPVRRSSIVAPIGHRGAIRSNAERRSRPRRRSRITSTFASLANSRRRYSQRLAWSRAMMKRWRSASSRSSRLRSSIGSCAELFHTRRPESRPTEAAERPLGRACVLRQAPRVSGFSSGVRVLVFVLCSGVREIAFIRRWPAVGAVWLRLGGQRFQKLVGADDGAAGAARCVPHRPVGGHDRRARAELAREPCQHVVGLFGRAREDHFHLTSRRRRAGGGSAIEDDREPVAPCPRGPRAEADKSRPPGLEALRLLGPEVRVATDDVIAVDEPAHRYKRIRFTPAPLAAVARRRSRVASPRPRRCASSRYAASYAESPYSSARPWSCRARAPSEATPLLDQPTYFHQPRAAAPDLAERLEDAAKIGCLLVPNVRHQPRHRLASPPNHERPTALRFPKQLGQAGLRFGHSDVGTRVAHARTPQVDHTI